MTLKLSNPVVSSSFTTASKLTGAGAPAATVRPTTPSIAAGPGGCYSPGDRFEPRPLPGPCFPRPPGNGGVDPIYRFQLRNMSSGQLEQEKFTQEVSLLVSQLTGDKAGASEARAKLGAISQEEARRAADGGDDNTVSLTHYKEQLRGMSDGQLNAEKRKEQGAYWRAKLSGDPEAAELAQKKLSAIDHEQMRRELNPFPIPFPRPFPLPREFPPVYQTLAR